jgi:F-type H+-transporting ATPase subunit epsilon
MKALTVSLLDGHRERRIDGVVSLVAADDSGQFGLLPGHEPLVTAIDAGLIRCRRADGSTRHLACTGGVFSCRGDEVQIVSARFLMGEREDELSAQLEQLLDEEQAEHLASRQSRTEVERALLKRLREWSEAGRK